MKNVPIFAMRRNNIVLNNAIDLKQKILPEPCQWHLYCFVADSIGSGFFIAKTKISEN